MSEKILAEIIETGACSMYVVQQNVVEVDEGEPFEWPPRYEFKIERDGDYLRLLTSQHNRHVHGFHAKAVYREDGRYYKI